MTRAAGPVFNHIADTLVDAFVARAMGTPVPVPAPAPAPAPSAPPQPQGGSPAPSDGLPPHG